MNKKKSIKMEKLGCTTMIVGKDATVDGSVIVAHSDDDVADERVIFVPGTKGNDPAKATRKVYYDNASLGSDDPRLKYNSTDTRRYIGNDRGPGYQTQSEGYAESIPLGEIPQAAETYAYFDGNYGIMNEHNLMIGECTCGAKVQPFPDPKKRIFYSAELSRVALERCKTAIEAITLIAKLIGEFGYYGTGETLLIGDCDEAWVMEMCGYDMEGENGIWVAQRVPDDHYFVAANEFRIRDVYMSDEDKKQVPTKAPYFKSKDPDNTVLYSRNLFAVCKEKDWIDEDATQLDWLPTVSNGEYSHPYYSLRRVWRAFSKAAPLSHLSAKVEGGYTRHYPFSLVPGKKLGVLDTAAIYRDHYEGTEFDLTKGTAAGPFGNPVRYDINPDQGDSFDLNTYKPEGAWERSISIYRCGMLWINQAKKVKNEIVGISWIGLDRPSANCLMPFHTQMPDLPESIQTMSILDFEFKGKSAWWAFNFVANYANLNYSYMMKDLAALQGQLESEAFSEINKALTGDGAIDTGKLIKFCKSHAAKVIASWWDLATRLIVQYNDGCLTWPKTPDRPEQVMGKIDYPNNWLKTVGFYNGPTRY